MEVNWSVVDLLERFGSGGRANRTGELFVVTQEPSGNFCLLMGPDALHLFRVQPSHPSRTFLPRQWATRVLLRVEQGARRLIVVGLYEALADEFGRPLSRF